MRAVTNIASLAIAVAMGAGCVTTHPQAVSTTPATIVAAPKCRTRSRLLSPSARFAGHAVLGKSQAGWVIVWNEKLGDRSTLRFLAVDGAGLPRSPSAEVVDRAGAFASVSVATEGDTHLVGWREDKASFVRKVDDRGRPRGDVTEDTRAMVSGEVATVCTAAGGALHCKTAHGADLIVPSDATIQSEAIGAAGDLVVASDASGLSLHALDCSAR